MNTHTTVTDILPGSPASKTSIARGDVLRTINGSTVNDVLDYEFYSYDGRLIIELTSGKTVKLVRMRKPEGANLGLVFESPLLDRERSCSNKCIFCFIDQMPKGLRSTLYYKDDDVRLSFLQGNYVTLTNLSEKDIERIIKLRISPINVSVHTLDPALREFMLGREKEAETSPEGAVPAMTDYITRLANAGIVLNCQIVCCPGINDKQELVKTIMGLMRLGKGINSVSVVPVGLTAHREGLYKLRPFDRTLARYTVRQVEYFGRRCRKERGRSVFYCADEMYMKAGFPLPPDSFYDGYPQLENGVGMMRLFITEFYAAMREYLFAPDGDVPAMTKSAASGSGLISVATGVLAAPYLTKLLQAASKRCGKINFAVYPVKNNFFGEGVTVSGLVTGKDIAAQLKGKELGEVLLIPGNMLRHDDVVFLDDMTIDGLSEALGVAVRAVPVNGGEFFREIICQDLL